MPPHFALSIVALGSLSLATPASAQLILPPSFYGAGPFGTGTGRVIVNPRDLYNGATVATPRTTLDTAQSGPFPGSPTCDPSQAPVLFTAPPAPQPGTFRPSITASSGTLRDRFAVPLQGNTPGPAVTGCQ